jgi:hypothetical protein
MKKILPLFLLTLILPLTSCTQQMMRAQVRESKVVVLDIGHYYHPERGGQGARTPDKRYGNIEECEYWYRYVGHTARIIREAGYDCRICCRGAMPTNKQLAEFARKENVHHVNTPEPTAIYRSKHHPHRMAVGMLSTNYALDQKPAAVIYLHHNSNSAKWLVCNKGAFYCNEVGVKMANIMAQVMDEELLNHGLPNNNQPCGVVLRNNGRLGGGDWLNACNESYVPALITEVTYLSNPEHAQFLSKHDNAVKYARTLGKRVLKFLQQR